jgi:hypothetical protein
MREEFLSNQAKKCLKKLPFWGIFFLTTIWPCDNNDAGSVLTREEMKSRREAF